MKDLTKNIQKNPHLVVIDDDESIRELVEAFFKQKNYTITSFEDSESFLAKVKTDGHKWDVVLSDLNLPVFSGIELTEKIKAFHPQLPVILITTNRNAQIALDAVDKGVYDFIVKPIHFPQLQISVERALNLKDLKGNLTELRAIVKQNNLTASGSPGIIGKSPKFVMALDIARRVAKSNASIFISGESGTGKEVFAKFIHRESRQSKGPFVAINCSAIPENLLESELFGHVKGAFTGAYDKKIGLFEEAEDGTLFLDEIGDLSLLLQAKLLRVLQEKKIKRVGENQDRTINCRIISATHKNLLNEIKAGQFREDLYFRLRVIPINLPALRERKEDSIPLAEYFLKKFSVENGSVAKSFSKEALKYMMDNTWRGNVRELENAIERAVVLADKSEIGLELLQSSSDESFSNQDELETRKTFQNGRQVLSDRSHQHVFAVNCKDNLLQVEEIVQKYVEFAVNLNNGARDKTAKAIGIDRKTLYRKLQSADSDLLN